MPVSMIFGRKRPEDLPWSLLGLHVVSIDADWFKYICPGFFRFVPVKSDEQQAILSLHRVRPELKEKAGA